MFNGVGGSTILFSGHWVRAMPSDFRVKTLDGVAEDWPFTYEDLRPFYDEVTHHIGASGPGGRPVLPRLPHLPAATAADRQGTAWSRPSGMDKLGWHWWPAPNAIASRKFRTGGLQRYGACESGCPVGAKASTDITHWPDAIEARRGAHHRRPGPPLTIDEQGLVAGAEYVDRDGRWHHQGAGLTVLAANGIGTPRLLLNSATSPTPTVSPTPRAWSASG